MYYLVTYDITDDGRLRKILKYCRRFFNWVQYSVFEGDLTDKQYEEFLTGINLLVRADMDSVLIFELRDRSVMTREVIGIEKNPLSNILP